MENMEYIKYGLLIVVVLIIFYFAQVPNIIRNKKLKQMHDGLKVGDKIVTYSGICGIIVEIFEDRVIIELNPDKNRISVEKWAIAGLDDRDIY